MGMLVDVATEVELCCNILRLSPSEARLTAPPTAPPLLNCTDLEGDAGELVAGVGKLTVCADRLKRRRMNNNIFIRSVFLNI